MIAKRVPRKEANSDFRHLAEYILDKKHDGQKLAAAWTTNTSLPDDFDMALRLKLHRSSIRAAETIKPTILSSA